MLKVMYAIIIFASINTDLIPVVSKCHDGQQTCVNKANRVSHLTLGTDDKEGNKTVRRTMRIIKHSNMRETGGSDYQEGEIYIQT